MVSGMKLHGTSRGRSLRSLWLLEELGVEYEHNPINSQEGAKQPEYLAVNANGKIPALEDDGLVLFESMAINLYLARKYDAGLQPKGDEDAARAVQWSVWAMTEIEPPLVVILRNGPIAPEDERNEAAAKEGEAQLQPPLGVLNDALDGRPYLLGADFSVADLNVASVLSWVRFLKVDLSGYPNVERWFRECTSRPALKKAQSLP